jgi:uncharacterized protein involved in exopolysaccharide biosynthesis
MTKRRGLIALVALVVAGAGFYAWARHDRVVARAQLLVIRKAPDPMAGPPRVEIEDYMATQSAVIRSLEIAKRATKTSHLSSRPSFQGEDGAFKVLDSLQIERDGNTNMLTLTVHGVGSEEGHDILSAVIEAYQKFLDEKYKTQSEALMASVGAAREKLEEDVLRARKELTEHYLSADAGTGGQSTVAEYGKQRDQLITTQGKQSVLRAKIDYVESCRNDPKMKEALFDHVLEWATKTGVSKDEVTVDRYINSLRFELGECDAIETALKTKIEATKDLVRKITASDLKEESLKRSLANQEALFAAITSKIQQIDVTKGGGYEISVISRTAPPPKK